MMWLAANWHLILLAVGGALLIAGSVWWAGYADRLEQAAKAAKREPITVQDIEEHGARAVDALEAYSNQEWAAGSAARANAALLDRYAVEHPMRQRPGLVDRAGTDFNPHFGDES